jgi:hypothetical protein
MYVASTRPMPVASRPARYPPMIAERATAGKKVTYCRPASTGAMARRSVSDPAMSAAVSSRWWTPPRDRGTKKGKRAPILALERVARIRNAPSMR